MIFFQIFYILHILQAWVAPRGCYLWLRSTGGRWRQTVLLVAVVVVGVAAAVAVAVVLAGAGAAAVSTLAGVPRRPFCRKNQRTNIASTIAAAPCGEHLRQSMRR